MMHIHEQQIIQKALTILTKYQKSQDILLNKVELVINFLRLKFEYCEKEVMSVLFLNNQNRLLEFEEMFYGTLHVCIVHAREIIKRALALNAAAVILAHNHPSGCAKPSEADKHLTGEIKQILALVDVKLLDHIIIGSGAQLSFLAQGLL